KLDNPYPLLGKLDADVLLEIKAGALAGQPDQVSYFAENVGDFVPIKEVEHALNVVIPPIRLEGTGISSEKLLEATQRIDMSVVETNKEGRAEQREFFEVYLTAISFSLMLYVTTLLSGLALSRGLLEEKANRVVEVLVSSVTPLQLMAGKVLGHALATLTQLGVWMLLGTSFYMRGAGGADAQKVLGAISPALLGCLVVYFLLGYLFYASLFAGVGAICTTEMEAQQTQTPLVLMLVLPM